MTTMKMHLFADGERYPMLHGASELPLFYPTLYATTQLRNRGAAVNTIKNQLADIQVLLRWESVNKRNLADEFGRGQLLSLPDVVSLRDFAKLHMRDAPSPEGVKHRKVVRLLEARTAPSKSRRAVGKQQHYNRISTFAEFLSFLASTVTQHRNDRALALQITEMVKRLRGHRPRGAIGSQVDDAHEKSPPTELIEEFMGVVSPDHPLNPFKNKTVRLRNWIIFLLFQFTGMRRGELLGLRIDHMDLGLGASVSIRRNQDDAFDSRLYQPVAKTKERVMPIPETVASLSMITVSRAGVITEN